METLEETIDTMTDDGEMAVVVTRPTAEGDHPVVLFFIDAPGLRPATREFMATLAGHGYTVITPDLHHRQGRLLHYEPKDTAADPELVKEIWGWIGAMTDDQIQHDGERALAAAGVPDDAPFATIGFCLGARAVYKAMERNPTRVVAGAGWHPSFLVDDTPESPHLTAGGLDRPLYLGIGEEDTIQSIAMHQKFLDAVEPLDHVQVKTFAGADHGYSWPGYPNFHEEAASTSWSATLEIFAQQLKQ